MLSKWKNELLSAITVSVVALPLALAFGIAAVGGPEGAIVGMYGAIFTGFFAAFFGGTKGQVTGPTGPITVVATGVIAQFGLENAFIVFMMAGILQILFGVFRLGSYIRYIPYPVITGFMNGIAIIIILGQIRYIQDSFLLVLITILLMLAGGKVFKSIPSSLQGLLGGTVIALLLGKSMEGLSIPLPFIGDVGLLHKIEWIGTIPSGIPTIHLDWSGLNLPILMELLPAAISIALLGSIDSLLTSVVMDQLTRTKHNSNKELIGQGIGNFMSGLFGGLAGAGATVRSVINLKSGGKVPAAILHSVFLLVIILGAGSLVAYVPQAVLGAILILTGFGMLDRASFRDIRTAPKGDSFVMLITMFVTIKFDLMLAVGIGVVLSALIFAKRLGDQVELVKEEIHTSADIFTVEGPVFFGSTDRFLDNVIKNSNKPNIILTLRSVNYIDFTGLISLVQLVRQLHQQQKRLILCGLNPKVKEILDKMDGYPELKNIPIYNTFDEAVESI